MDPQGMFYPDYSSYCYLLNSPIWFGEPNGEYVNVTTKRFKMLDANRKKL
jgi:hypothetical protein